MEPKKSPWKLVNKYQKSYVETYTNTAIATQTPEAKENLVYTKEEPSVSSA